MIGSYWHDTAPEVPLPATADLPEAAEVVVVGAGIAGLMIAEELRRRGRDVVVLEMRRAGHGTTGASTAKVTALHGASLQQVARHHGEEGARHYVEANVLGVAKVAEVVRRLDADVGWLPSWSATYTTDPAQLDRLDAEWELARRVGLPLERVDTLELPVEVAGAVTLADQGAVDPARFAAALGDTLLDGGTPLISGCTVLGVEAGSAPVLHTDRGELRAQHVVIATLLPVVDPLGLFARVVPTMSYSLVARLDGPAPEGLHLSVDTPTRSIRPVAGDEHLVVVGGGGHRVGEGDPLSAREELRSWVVEHLSVHEVLAEWSAHDLVPSDDVPFIGPTGQDDTLLVASGFRKWGFSHAGAASVLVADLLDGDRVEWATTFDPRRPIVTSLGSVGEVVKGNVTVGRHLVGDKARTLHPPSVEALGPGEGGIVDAEGTKVAAYRDEQRALSMCSATCTHLGCQVVWNPAARSWDCPCHGSRFGVHGEVLAGPASRPLDRVEPGDD